MTTTSATGSATTNVLTALGAGSGIDIPTLVTSLTQAQFANKTDQLKSKSDTLDKQISDVGTLLGSLQNFSTSLSSLASGGTLSTAPTSSNSAVVGVSALPGASLAGLSSSIEVRQIASAQSAATTVLDPAASIGTGTLTLSFGKATVGTGGSMTDFVAGSGAAIPPIAIDAAHATLKGIASAINAANAGVTASVVSDGGGARLVLRGRTGESQGFTLAATEDAGAPGLSALDIGPGATGTAIGSAAGDAIVAVDGVAFHRASNQISDLVNGVKLSLTAAAPGTSIAIGTTAPTAALTQAAGDFVDTFNQLHTMIGGDLDAKTGSLHSDVAAAALARALTALTSRPLLTGQPAGAPTTLAEIGVATNRDGSLKLDTAKLQRALASYPDAVEAMFASADKSSSALPAAMAAITTAAANTATGLARSQSSYTAAKGKIADQQAKLTTDEDSYKARLTQQFSSMDSRVAAYKSTQTFLQNQIAAWNKSNN